MASNLTIYASLDAQTEEQTDRWCATQEALGLYAYGETADDASRRLMIAVNLLIDTLLAHGGKDAVTSRLDRAGIAYTLVDEPESHRKLPVTLTLAKSLESA